MCHKSGQTHRQTHKHKVLPFIFMADCTHEVWDKVNLELEGAEILMQKVL